MAKSDDIYKPHHLTWLMIDNAMSINDKHIQTEVSYYIYSY